VLDEISGGLCHALKQLLSGHFNCAATDKKIPQIQKNPVEADKTEPTILAF
jgi:hypothetical protein